MVCHDLESHDLPCLQRGQQYRWLTPESFTHDQCNNANSEKGSLATQTPLPQHSLQLTRNLREQPTLASRKALQVPTWGVTQLAASHVPCFEQELTWRCAGPVDYKPCSQRARSASWRWRGWLEGRIWKQNPHPNWKFSCALLLILFSTAQCNHPCVLLFKKTLSFSPYSAVALQFTLIC